MVRLLVLSTVRRHGDVTTSGLRGRNVKSRVKIGTMWWAPLSSTTLGSTLLSINMVGNINIIKTFLSTDFTSGFFKGNPKKELRRLSVWGPAYRVSLGIKIKAFNVNNGGNIDKFLRIGPRHPLIAINNQSLYIQTMLNSNTTGYSFKPTLNKFYNFVVSQFIENNEV